jgi:hypothetical protein
MKDGQWLKKILIGGLLIVGSFLVIPVFFLMGYLLRILEEGLRESRQVPDFDEWDTMFVRGLAGFGICIGYPLLSLPIFLVGDLLPGAAGALFQFLGLMAVVVGVYLIPAGLANYVRYNDFWAGFDTDFVLALAREGSYFQTWLVAALIGIVGGFLSNLLTVILVGFFLQFYVNVVIFYLFGQGIAGITGTLD